MEDLHMKRYSDAAGLTSPAIAAESKVLTSHDSDSTETTTSEEVVEASTGTQARERDRGLEVYAHIKLIDSRFRCTLCSSSEHGGWASRNTPKFWLHIRTKHLKEYRELRGTEGPMESTTEGATGSSTPTGATSTMEALVATSAPTEWIINGSHSLDIVEQRGFRDFCNALQPQYQVPNRQAVPDRVMKRWVDHKLQVRQTLLRQLQGTHRASLTVEQMSSTKPECMAVTLHYIDDQWNTRSVVLAYVRLVYPHSGARLARRLISAVTNMDKVLLGSLWTVTADNASISLDMVNELNLSLRRSPLKGESTRSQVCCPDLDAALGELREAVRTLQENPGLLEKYVEECKSWRWDGKKDCEGFKLDVVACWSTTYGMVEHLLHCTIRLDELSRRISGQCKGYSHLAGDLADSIKIKPESWTLAEVYRSFLEPFKDAVTLLSGTTYPTMGLVGAVYRSIRLYVDRLVESQEKEVQRLNETSSKAAPTVSAVLGFRETVALMFFKGVQSKLCEYEDIALTREAKIAGGLDPRCRGYQPTETRQLIIDEFMKCYNKRFEDNYRALTVSTRPSKLQKFSQLMADSVGVSTAHRARECIEEEVDDWLALTPMKLDSDARSVYSWFKENGDEFPRLKLMARDFLAIPATSISSEAAFSKARCTISNRRARLGAGSLEMISELQSFMAFNRGDQSVEN
ncbi:hypothetical protein Poli38472_012376 [Pythium oligandrum]|uniref:HAT C-terminal dimerisation domain-containing protein n=1 Tax=Pythium oligandrum TaxID=41045 RepID=A0A8K1FKL9_PYTOL|nr:hypothetical protein Poli38472_012376 [Pythium oligandrum]|eukprot:TMW67260.1 hypothetical protein Poli38472_012376 [Pythium oligandrum]